jgi:tight adherence protein B
MNVLKLFVLLIGFGAGALIASVGLPSFAPTWNRLIGRYVDWVLAAERDMGSPVTEPWAQRLITASLLVPTALVVAIGAWPLLLVAVPGGVLAPYGWIRYKRKVYRDTMDSQLVDAMVLMANAMKSGLSLLQAVEMAAAEMKPPIVHQFEIVQKEVQLGTGIDQALLAMSDRVNLPDLEIAVHSIVTLRETGGNLSETFMTVANTIVERKKVEGKIGSLTAQGVYQGAGMCAMPFVMAAVFYVMDPDYMYYMFTTTLGWLIWVVVIVLDALGMWAILKVVKIDV